MLSLFVFAVIHQAFMPVIAAPMLTFAVPILTSQPKENPLAFINVFFNLFLTKTVISACLCFRIHLFNIDHF